MMRQTNYMKLQTTATEQALADELSYDKSKTPALKWYLYISSVFHEKHFEDCNDFSFTVTAVELVVWAVTSHTTLQIKSPEAQVC